MAAPGSSRGRGRRGACGGRGRWPGQRRRCTPRRRRRSARRHTAALATAAARCGGRFGTVDHIGANRNVAVCGIRLEEPRAMWARHLPIVCPAATTLGRGRWPQGLVASARTASSDEVLVLPPPFCLGRRPPRRLGLNLPLLLLLLVLLWRDKARTCAQALGLCVEHLPARLRGLAVDTLRPGVFQMATNLLVLVDAVRVEEPSAELATHAAILGNLGCELPVPR
mmetsp:Transcript_1741/g.4376  ORF Transcript_1741/g.4376 Transcript_1741/m.4376 type:complete len:225 (-) Transcript_1741:35-709(-)